MKSQCFNIYRRNRKNTFKLVDPVTPNKKDFVMKTYWKYIHTFPSIPMIAFCIHPRQFIAPIPQNNTSQVLNWR